jgi:hypothetical protein
VPACRPAGTERSRAARVVVHPGLADNREFIIGKVAPSVHRLPRSGSRDDEMGLLHHLAHDRKTHPHARVGNRRAPLRIISAIPSSPRCRSSRAGRGSQRSWRRQCDEQDSTADGPWVSATGWHPEWSMNCSDEADLGLSHS